MTKYDKAEAKAKYLASPEYHKKLEEDQQAKERAKRQAELDKKMEEINKKLKEEQEQDTKVNVAEVNAKQKEIREQ